MKSNFKHYWHLHQEVIVDECMVRCKGSYCPNWKYIPKKPTKWRIKVCCLADAKTNYVYDFFVYTGSAQHDAQAGGTIVGAKSGYEVVMLLTQGFHGRGHIIVTDSF